MELLKAMESTIGKMEVSTRVTSNMEYDMAMESGEIKNKFIKVAIEWIRNKDWESINGLVSKFTKDSLEMILEKAMGSSILLRRRSRRLFTKDVGHKVKNGKKVSPMRKR